MTVCNLNRVNCHNAFVAMYELKLALANTSLSAEEKVSGGSGVVVIAQCKVTAAISRPV